MYISAYNFYNDSLYWFFYVVGDYQQQPWLYWFDGLKNTGYITMTS